MNRKATALIVALGAAVIAATSSITITPKGILHTMSKSGCHWSQLPVVLALSGIDGNLRMVPKGTKIVMPENCGAASPEMARLAGRIIKDDYVTKAEIREVRLALAQKEVEGKIPQLQEQKTALEKDLARLSQDNVGLTASLAAAQAQIAELFSKLVAAKSPQVREEVKDRPRQKVRVEEKEGSFSLSPIMWGLLAFSWLLLLGVGPWIGSRLRERVTRMEFNLVPRKVKVALRSGKEIIFPVSSYQSDEDGERTLFFRCGVAGCDASRLTVSEMDEHVTRRHPEVFGEGVESSPSPTSAGMPIVIPQ
jgi:hypothetical protein